MPVCNYYLNGKCKFGNNCRNQHPQHNVSARSNLAGGDGRGQNRFDALANDYRQRGSNYARQEPNPLPYKLDKERIRTDLTQDRPNWIFSSYAPTQEVPRQLFGGLPREQSCEELRVRHYELAAAGQEQQAVDEARTIYDSAEKQIQEALGNLDGAVQYIIAGKDEQYNRLEICKESTRTGFFNSSSSVSSQPPSFVKPQNTLFGQPSLPAKPQALGQPSLLGRPTNPFSKPSETQTFGRPSQLGNAQPWASNQNSTIQNPFAQSTDQSTTGFGNLGTSSMAIDNPKTPQPTGFENLGTSSMTIDSPKAPQPTGFAQNTTAPFGQGAFGPISGRGDANTGTLSAPQAIPQPSNAPSSNLGLQGSSFPATASNATRDIKKDANGRLVSWKGKQVSYMDEKPCFRRPDGNWERIWFPEAPGAQKDEEALAGRFTEALKEDYRYLHEHGTFKDGFIPELPPKREWRSWDF